MTDIPNPSALLNFDPAPGPATTQEVFAETLDETLAPKANSKSFASARLIVSMLPVKTQI
jgi:hypothetical protein